MTTILGLSYEVYLINIVIAIPTFLILRWILKKKIKNQNTRKLSTWIGTIILTPLIYILGIITMFTIMGYEPDRDFEKERWFAHPELRYEMRDDLVESEILTGKTKDQIIEFIGKTDKGQDMNKWDYNLGMSGNGFGWQFNNLILTFENEQVIKTEKIEIKD